MVLSYSRCVCGTRGRSWGERAEGRAIGLGCAGLCDVLARRRLERAGEGGGAHCLLCSYCTLTRARPALTHSSDPFLRKEWYDVKAPSTFAVRNACKTCVNRTAGTSA